MARRDASTRSQMQPEVAISDWEGGQKSRQNQHENHEDDIQTNRLMDKPGRRRGGGIFPRRERASIRSLATPRFVGLFGLPGLRFWIEGHARTLAKDLRRKTRIYGRYWTTVEGRMGRVKKLILFPNAPACRVRLS
jgi:hypothetical protein